MENKVYKEDLEGKAFDRWWRWGITGVYLAYRIYLSIAY